MLVLGIDTSTMMTSVALVRGGAVVDAIDLASALHSDVLLVTIDELMRRAGIAPAQVDVVAVGAGPGSFTGLRIAMATAKGIAFATERPLFAISSLAALAWDAAQALGGELADRLLVPVFDARRGELYAGFYVADGAGVTSVSPDRVIAPADLGAAIDSLRGTAPSAVVFGDVTKPPLVLAPPHTVMVDLRATPSGIAVATLASIGDHPDVLTSGAPLYIRPAEAEVKYPDGVPGAQRRR